VRRLLVLVLSLAALGLGGCIHHRIAFHPTDPSWHHQVGGEPIPVDVFAVVPETTRQAEYEISSFMAGAANRWHARYGEMFVQAVQVELPQLFRAATLGEGAAPAGTYELSLDVPAYTFSGFAARTTVSAVLRDPAGAELMNERYEGVGGSDAGKVVGLGVFGMRSAIRQSTLDAYLRVFAQMRDDLRVALADRSASGRADRFVRSR
jgi:hypothetical protein